MKKLSLDKSTELNNKLAEGMIKGTKQLYTGELHFLKKDTCFEYSEDSEALKDILKDSNINVRSRIGSCPWGEEELRLTYSVEMERRGRKISFNFYSSIRDTLAFNDDCSQGAYKCFFPLGAKDVYFHDKYTTRLRRNPKLSKAKQEARKEHFKSLLYSILSTCGAEYHCPIVFSEFCDIFGYDTDSMKAKKTWEACLEQSSKLQRLFSEVEIQNFPS